MTEEEENLEIKFVIENLEIVNKEVSHTYSDRHQVEEGIFNLNTHIAGQIQHLNHDFSESTGRLIQELYAKILERTLVFTKQHSDHTEDYSQETDFTHLQAVKELIVGDNMKDIYALFDELKTKIQNNDVYYSTTLLQFSNEINNTCQSLQQSINNRLVDIKGNIILKMRQNNSEKFSRSLLANYTSTLCQQILEK